MRQFSCTFSISFPGFIQKSLPEQCLGLSCIRISPGGDAEPRWTTEADLEKQLEESEQVGTRTTSEVQTHLSEPEKRLSVLTAQRFSRAALIQSQNLKQLQKLISRFGFIK